MMFNVQNFDFFYLFIKYSFYKRKSVGERVEKCAFVFLTTVAMAASEFEEGSFR